MNFEIRHRVSARLRLRLPELTGDTDLLQVLQAWSAAHPCVDRARANPACDSLLLDFDAVDEKAEAAFLDDLAKLGIDDLLELEEQREPRVSEGLPALVSPFAAASVALPASLIGGPVGCAVCTAAVLYAVLPSYRNAFRVLRHERRLNVDFLDVLAVTLSLARGGLVTAALMAWLIRLGDAIRDRTARHSNQLIDGLLDFQTQHCWVVRDGTKVEVPVAGVAAGETVVVYAGALIPVDGEVSSGSAAVDQRTITGESLPVAKQPGSSVYAGTHVQEGQLYVRATAVRNETAIARIVQTVRDTPMGETRIQNYAEKFADRLVMPTLGLALGTFATSGNLDRLLSMLIVDYGTGIRVAAPTTILASIQSAARQGVLIKSGSVIEKLAGVDSMVFDKTGTITYGLPKVFDVASYAPAHFSTEKLLALAAGAEARHMHPVAQAVVARAREKGLDIPVRQHSQFQIGRGVEARINGYDVWVGSDRYLMEKVVRLSAAHNDLRRAYGEGMSALLVAVNGELVGLLPYADQIRPEMPRVVQQLHERGIRDLLMLTGDNASVAQAVSARVGLTGFRAGILPDEKAQIVCELRAAGRTVGMVGDGVNDSPALAHADVAISMKNGTDVTRHIANVVLMDDTMSKLVTAIDLSRGSVRLVRQNFGIIAGLNTLALALSIPAGLVSPNVTALISNGSAILASVNAIRPALHGRLAAARRRVRPIRPAQLPAR